MKHNNLNLTSKVKNLFLYDSQIEINRSVNEINTIFQENNNIPGIIITKNKQIIGIISRKKYTEYMARPYSLELFLNRSIENLYQFIKTDFLIIPGKTSITKAVQKLLEGSLDLTEEPIIIETSPQVYKLLDINQLMVAHSEIQIYANHLICKLYKELKISNKKLKEIATLDGLTGVSNRRKFDEYLQQEWKRAIREKLSISLILSDVDCFKSYNDTYGHQAGDICLRSIAKAMVESVRRPADLVARYGGEEFALILPNTETEGAICIAEQIRNNIADLKIPHSKSIVKDYVTVSLGIFSLIPHRDRNMSPKKFIVAADRALYQAKKTGRNRYVIYSPKLDDTQSDSKILSNLRDDRIRERQQKDSSQSSLEKQHIKPSKSPQKLNNSHIIDLIRLATVRANINSPGDRS